MWFSPRIHFYEIVDVESETTKHGNIHQKTMDLQIMRQNTTHPFDARADNVHSKILRNHVRSHLGSGVRCSIVQRLRNGHCLLPLAPFALIGN